MPLDSTPPEGAPALFYGWVLLSLVELEEGEGGAKTYRFAVLGFETDAERAAKAPIAWPLDTVETAPVVLVVVNSLVEGYHTAGRVGCAAVIGALPDLGGSTTFLGLAELPDMLAECVQQYEVSVDAAEPAAGGTDGN